ncbi:sensor histidine kinase [Chitinophaga vietnamensis]|uniref:sensor histidine kinase n=1 Tax=Chitinophaga vietnamensis TaxID=2593957 RepID=UPI00117804FF|nr:hypothetical protein [Chitinophaga vietnamensis]
MITTYIRERYKLVFLLLVCLAAMRPSYAKQTPSRIDSLSDQYDYYLSIRDDAAAAATAREIWLLAREQRPGGNDSINYITYFVKAREREALAMKNRVQEEQIIQRNLEKRNTQLLFTGMISIVALLLIWLIVRYYHYRRSKQQERELAIGYAAIAEKNAALRAADEFKNKLITIIANDFRAPLHHIIEVAGVLQHSTMDKEEMIQVMKHIAASSQKTLAVFDNILRWIKLQLSGFVFKPVTCQVQEQMALATEMVKEAANARGMAIVDRIPANVKVAADPEMLQFVNRHFLLTAIKYAVTDGLIIIDAWPEEEVVRVNIAIDSGTEAADIVNGLFAWQEDTYALGMAISKDFIEKMEGEAIAEESGGRYLTLTYLLKSR